ncbi:MAG: isoprenylcysteine carboxylmethyltransferase family protein [Planctomycetes bacterium]|nr:isoprenylcysteine carboxylmethyltransferase family protein [Planctomycetota bacterium]
MHAHELLFAAWVFTEALLALRHRSTRGLTPDPTVRVLWVTMTLGIGLALGLSFVAGWRLPGDLRAWYVGGCAAMSVGLVVRWWAVLVLGRFFTVDVAIQSGHELVVRGPYRFVRHPSYTGLVLVLFGVCGVLGSALSAFALLACALPPLAWRIAVEERTLAGRFGVAWSEYARRTKRLVPFVL